MIKDILVSLSLDQSRDYAGDYAMSVAELFGARLDGIAFALFPVLSVTMPMEALGVDVISAEVTRNRRAAQAALNRFEHSLRAGGLGGGAEVLEAGVAEAAKKFSQRARSADISIVGQVSPEAYGGEILIEGALFGSGRPLIVVPYIQRDGIKLDRVTVCWDGSRAAARAVGDAMPFLVRARQVDVLTVTGAPRKGDELPGTDIAPHLARHGISAEVKRSVATDIDTTNAILSHLADRDSNLLVMGGYGHSRLREYALGGVTRGILESMTVPVLMSH